MNQNGNLNLPKIENSEKTKLVLFNLKKSKNEEKFLSKISNEPL